MPYSGYKANLLQNARYQMSQAGGRAILRKEHVHFYAADGRTCVVWFPMESRVHDLEIADLKDAITEMSGHKPFSL